ncbi:MAG: alkaline phosphatase family protein, partial [Bacteroidota bacterium]
KIPAGVVENAPVQKALTDGLQKQFNVPGLVTSYINYQFHLNDSLIKANKLDKKEIKNFIATQMLQQTSVLAVVDLENLANEALPEKLKKMLTNSYNQKLSGQVQVIPKPQWFENWRLGTTHGLWNPYDAHIPLVFMGWGIKPGKLNREVYMSDIAPTLGALLKVQMPNASVGDVISEVISIPVSTTNSTGPKK